MVLAARWPALALSPTCFHLSDCFGDPTTRPADTQGAEAAAGRRSFKAPFRQPRTLARATDCGRRALELAVHRMRPSQRGRRLLVLAF